MGELLQKAKVRRIIPDKVTLSNRVTAVMLEYKHITDPVHHVPLLNEQAWHAFQDNLNKVQDDLLSGMPQHIYEHVIDCSMIEELHQLHSLLNHNPYDDFEAPPIDPPERFSFDWAPGQLEGAFEQQQERALAAEKVAPSDCVTEVEGDEDVLNILQGKSAAAGKNPPGNRPVPVRLASTPTPQSVPLSAAAGATPGHPPHPLQRPGVSLAASPSHQGQLRAGASLAASPSRLGKLVLLLGIPLLQLAGAPQLQLAGMHMAATTSQANWSHLWNGPASSRLRQPQLQLAEANSAAAGQSAAANTHEINEQIDQAVADIAGLQLWEPATQQVTAAPSVEKFSSYMPLSGGQMSKSSSEHLLPSSAAKRPAQQASLGFPLPQKSPNDKPKKVQKRA
ncbi:TPA: hypothetical protein ACH3X3_005144 [Trebouxia sp. C0006]